MPLTASQISSSFPPEIILHILSFLIGFAVSSLLFAMMFKWLPDAEIGWRDVQRTGEPLGSFAMDIPHNTTWEIKN